MQNERPEGWWASTPKIVNGKFLVVAILPDGEETTSLFSLDELESHLTPVAADVCQWCGAKYIETPGNDCLVCGKRR